MREVAVHDTAVAGCPAPKVTAVAPVRLVPVMVTAVPPLVVPVAGLTEVAAGAGGTVATPNTVTVLSLSLVT